MSNLSRVICFKAADNDASEEEINSVYDSLGILLNVNVLFDFLNGWRAPPPSPNVVPL